ncbi:MAG: SRPBCC domain-containing protein [Chloroflexota bacterium]
MDRRTGGSHVLRGQRPIKVDRATVWSFVNDPTKVAACGPASRASRRRHRNFKVTAKVGIGIIRATFVGHVAWAEERSPTSRH